MGMHWDEYWQLGHITSFGESFKGNYSGMLRNIWCHEFETLPDNFKVLDIATGNGALPLLISQCLINKKLSGHIDGIDLAKIKTEINNHDLSESIKIKLKGGVNCDCLPFDNEKYDLIVSQYGIEYSNLSKSIPEAVRVLKSGGRLSIVTHHYQSFIINRNRRILNILCAEETSHLFDIMKQLVNAMGTIVNRNSLKKIKVDQSCERLRNQLNFLISRLAAIDEDGFKDSGILSYVSTIFQQGLYWTVDKKIKYITCAEAQISALNARLTDLVASALNETDIANLISMFVDCSVALDKVITVEDDKKRILAWKVSVVKP